ncbi:MAG: hypothetical protein AABM33_04430 [Pseudomonadota bacterium]
MNRPGEAAAPRSSFITGLAWMSIAVAGFATLISLLQYIMVSLMFPVEEIRAALRESEKTQPMPALVGLMVENLRLLFGLILAMSVVTLVSSIGLLKRRNWARLIFIGMMALAAVGHLAGAAAPFFMFSSFSPVPDNAPADLRENAELVVKIVMGFTAVLSIVLAALFGWLVKRLLSDDIRREFRAL